MAEGDIETEIEPLKANYDSDIIPSAPIEEDLPNYDNIVLPAPNQQIIIEPINPHRQQILVEEKQPLYPENNQNIPLDNMVVPSQEQIAAILPSFDNTSSKSNKKSDGIGYIAGCQESPHIITWLVTIIMWTMFILSIIGSLLYLSSFGQYWWIYLIIGCVLYIINLIETGCSAMHKYLSNILEQEGAKQFIDRLKNEAIEIWWTVRCYHWETRTRVVRETDSNGNRRTRHETYREKVYTWTNTQQYEYNLCIDVSGDILGLEEHKLTRLRLHKAYEFANDITKQHYMNQQEMFKRNNWRDTYQEFNEETKICGFIQRILAESEPGIKPKWMDLSFFWLFSVFGISPCYRQALVARCGNIDFALIKQISIA